MTKNIDAAHGSATYTLQTPLKEHRSEYGQPRAAFIGVSIFGSTSPKTSRLMKCRT